MIYIPIQLLWLTYGNYLSFLNRFSQGIVYFKYLLDKLPKEDAYCASIHNNMGLMYTKKYEENKDNYQRDEEEENYYKKAIEAYEKALKYVKQINSSSVNDESKDQSYDQLSTIGVMPSDTSIDRSKALGTLQTYIIKDINMN
ncbi:unnamed protein product [Didymodactylos carnosus]|uniref:Uncharacterized protein n=1 Tax=Didymodactylos carnosus TaxID=1234261 RepID=A0A816A451_9BILA|nr:unnamed protein product [Didymodactylos carnosus]CAF4464369.1 unnamed protein product [Didymodactylos carnosus]